MAQTSKSSMAYVDLNERAQHLLKVLVERYICDGQPVGSRTLSRETGLELSPATIRNVMADLEELGFLHSPHTSAGRMPTVQGYRFFVDTLLQTKPLCDQEVEVLKRRLDPAQTPTDLMQSVSSLLSGVTHLAGVVMVPRQTAMALRQVEFLPLSDNRVLAILVVNEREVQNRIIHTQRRYTEVELQQAANYLNAQCGGKDIHQVREDLLRDMESARESMDRLMQTVIEMADKTFQSKDQGEENVFVDGEINLMDFAELSGVEKLRQLFDAFNRKRDILILLDQCLHARGVQIFIGEEAGFEVLDSCSVVTAPYSAGGQGL